jgi:hypothetical protein
LLNQLEGTFVVPTLHFTYSFFYSLYQLVNRPHAHPQTSELLTWIWPTCRFAVVSTPKSLETLALAKGCSWEKYQVTTVGRQHGSNHKHTLTKSIAAFKFPQFHPRMSKSR